MANIKVALDYTILDGQPLTFRSPADCSKVTGLVVYYPEGGTNKSKTFQFADAHGNNVGSIDLFAANVLVKVILDTEANRAYVQNADTNAYLEGELAKKYSPTNKPTAADVGAVAKDGSVPMSGNLLVANPDVNQLSVRFRPADGGQHAINGGYSAITISTNEVVGDYAKGRTLMLRNAKAAASIVNSLILRDTVNGANTDYSIYHTGNKPTAADVGALALNGSNTMTGNLTIERAGAPTFKGINTATGRDMYIETTSDSYTAIANRKIGDANNRVMLWLAPETETDLSRQLRLYRVVEGKGTAYSIYGTHNKPTAADVGALKFYGSFEELGLTEATATVEGIVNAMANGSMLMVNCSTAGVTSGLLPTTHGLLTVEKRSNYFTSFEYRTIANFWRGYYNAASGGSTWSGWFLIATTDYALARDGSNTMTGNLSIEKNTPIVNLSDAATGAGGRVFNANNRLYMQAANVAGADANRRQFVVVNSAVAGVAKALVLNDVVENNAIAYTVLHTGNVTAGTTDITAGSALATGSFYDVYE